jgi:hypothetical protein
MIFELIFFILSALGCEIPKLPPEIDYFGPDYKDLGHLEGSGRFLLDPDISWNINVAQTSWFRVLCEPKLASLEMHLSQFNQDLQAAQCNSLESAMIALILNPGNYKLNIASTRLAEYDNSSSDCSYPNMYFNIGLHPYHKLNEFVSENVTEEELDLTGMQNAISDNLPYTYTSGTFKITPRVLKDPPIATYKINVPAAKPDLIESGYTGLWKLSFSIRKY